MKSITRICFYIISFLLSFGLLAEGFSAGTLVATQYGLIPVESIVVGTSICNEYFVTRLISNTVDSYAKIFLEDCCIEIALNQKFCEANKGWINAEALLPSDRLLCFDGTTIQVTTVEIIDTQQKMYAFSVETNHIFYVTSHGIITHNFELVSGGAIVCLSIACPPAGVGLAIVEAISAGVFCFGAYLLHRKHQKQKKQSCIAQHNKVANTAGGNGRDPKDKEEEKYKAHPHGIYEDVPYHRTYNSGNKSAKPCDGQKCLDCSLEIEGSRQRVGIENDMFVVFKQTMPGKYHGYLITWKDIITGGNSQMEAIRKTLIRSGWVTKTGKIIKLQ